MAADQINAIFFDLDNTLCDVEGSFAERYQAGISALIQQDSRWTEEELLQRTISMDRSRGRLSALLVELGVNDSEAGRAALEAENEVLFSKLKLFPQILESLDVLSEYYVLGIITNGLAAQQTRKLRTLQLERFFPIIIIDEKLGTSKPNAEIFEVAIAKAGCKPNQAMYVGDQWDVDVRGANLAGLHAVWINHDGLEQPKFGHAKFVLHSVAELPEALGLSTPEM
ncbi:MAG: HAD family hydrolase [SAR202 cluster bacterium]|nr:HAD family hydrolase [SAR202 cluster bacterium]|tara:strand:- start:2270 stop:2947 length:678 start_codon:yes stop_codon:yes gene_type:complete